MYPIKLHEDQLQHPNVHREASSWSEEQVLHVACCYSNPRRWETRRRLANDFTLHMRSTRNVVLHVIELAYGDRPFDVTNPARYPFDIQRRTTTELWHKENLLNLAIHQFPADWRYGAIVDMDFTFTRADWALEAIHLLQHYRWVQLFTEAHHITGSTVPGKGHRSIGTLSGFSATYAENGHSAVTSVRNKEELLEYMVEKPKKWQFPGAPGGAWAFRREALNEVGGLLDRCILGSADSFMAFGLVGSFCGMRSNMMTRYTEDYRNYILAWQRRAAESHGDIGFLDQFVVHHFHGRLKNRGYHDRDNILIDNQYSPTIDVFPDSQGVLQLSPHRPRLRDQLREYFLSRCEDVPYDT